MADFTYLSFGAGVQSSAILCLCEHGEYRRPDVAIFADTGDEPQWVYEWVEQAKRLTRIPIETVTAGILSEDIASRHNGARKRCAAIPAWTAGVDARAVPLNRHCTADYKIAPIERRVRALLGVKPRCRIRAAADCFLGISVDEVMRAKPSRTAWVTNVFPLLDLRLRRADCETVLRKNGWPVPRKSSCIFCPFHSDAYWRDLRDNWPDEWQKAVQFDAVVRNMSASGVRNPVYLHRSLKPLAEVNLDDKNGELFGNECTGHCAL